MDPVIDIGTGVYSVVDAANLLKVPPQRISAWIRHYWENMFTDDGHTYTTEPGHKRLFNFHTLMEIIVVHTMREKGISFKRIVEAHKALADLYQTSHPFAKKEFMFFGKEIIHNLDKHTSLHLNQAKQIAIRELIEPYCQKIEFNSITELAEKYYPLGKGKLVVLDPMHQMGMPIIDGTNIYAATLYQLVKAGEDERYVADLYDLPMQAVQDAVVFYNKSA